MFEEIRFYIKYCNDKGIPVTKNSIIKEFNLFPVQFQTLIDKLYSSNSLSQSWDRIDNQLQQCFYIR
jgi:hypothetical protein